MGGVQGNKGEDEAGADEDGEGRQGSEMEGGEFNCGDGSVLPETRTDSARDSNVEMTTVTSGEDSESSSLASKKRTQV